jgi:5-methylcytosine-specific restriction enzyme subunit McrC
VQREELGEYRSKTIEAEASPTPSDENLAARLRGDDEQEPARLDVRWLTNGKVYIRTTSWVGVARFSQLEVHILPKLAGGKLRVLRMLEYALGVRMLRRLPDDATLTAKGHDLLDLVCLLLAEETQALLRGGLLRDYRETDDTLPVLRGRLRYRDQYLRRFGQLDRLECHFDEYESNTPDNQLLAAGLEAARRHAKDRDVRFSAVRLGGLLQEACEPPTADADWYERTIRYTRRNAGYRPAHELAKLLLRQLAFDDLFNSSGDGVTAFMINMNTVFERFVIRLVAEAFAESETIQVSPHTRLKAVIRNDDTGLAHTAIDPDLVIEHQPTGVRVPLDVKYKLYDNKKVAVGDIYQTFLYAFALGNGELHRAGIIFPATAIVSGPTLSVRQLDGPTSAKIAVLGLDIPKTLDDLQSLGRPDLLATTRAAVEQLSGLGYASHCRVARRP